MLSVKKPFIFGFAGWSGSGKTTLAEKVIKQSVKSGISISTLKHAHHNFDADIEGKDSFRHRAAGAGQVLVASAKRTALFTEKTEEKTPELSDLLLRLDDCDWVLVEGFKKEVFPKIEIFDEALSPEPLFQTDKNIIAVVGLKQIETGNLPYFDRDDVTAIFSFLRETSQSQLDER